MTKVAIFTNSMAGGGMERAMLNVAKYLRSQGASVDLLVASAKGPLLDEVPNNIDLVDLKAACEKQESFRWWLLKAAFRVEPLFLLMIFVIKLPKSIKVIPGLVNYINRYSPDVILSTPTTANLAMLWSARFCDFSKKVIVREATTLTHEINHNNSPFFKFVKKLVPKWYSCSDVVICVSTGVKEDLRSSFNISENQLMVLPNIIDLEEIRKKSESDEHMSSINLYKPFILSIGRLEQSKDFKFLIEAFHMIADKVSCNLLILGEGSERKNLEKLVHELSLSSRVYFPGYKMNPYPYIKNCKVFALSSRWEGSPNVLREALVFNKKIISTDCDSGPREILKHGKAGILVEVGDIATYSKQLLKTLQEDVLYNQELSTLKDQDVTVDFFNSLLQVSDKRALVS